MQDEGLVRATARQILVNDIKAGKIKNITVEEAINMGEPLDPFRQIYGEGALEQLDSLIPNLRNLKTEMEAEKLARSKFKFEPDEARPKESYTKEEMGKILKEGETESKGLDYLMGVTPNKKTEVIDIKLAADKRKSVDDLIDEYNANQDRLLLTDDEGGTLITYPEYNRLRDRNDEIAKVLEEKGIRSTPEVETQPEGQVIPFRKKPTEPEGKANGGRIGFKIGSGKKILKSLGFNTRSEFEKLNLKHDKDIVKAADEIGANLDDPKMGAQQIAEVYADMKFGKDYYDLPQNQQLDLYSKAYNYLTDMGSLRRQSKAVEKYNAGEKLGQFDQKMIDQINDRQQKEILTNFDTTERKPNSKGGLNYLLGL